MAQGARPTILVCSQQLFNEIFPTSIPDYLEILDKNMLLLKSQSKQDLEYLSKLGNVLRNERITV